MDLLLQTNNFGEIYEIYYNKVIKFYNNEYGSIDEFAQDLIESILENVDIKNIEYKILVKKLFDNNHSIRENKIMENFVTDMVIKDNYYLLKGYSKKKLQGICRRNYIKNYSRLNKSDLIDLIKSELQE